MPKALLNPRVGGAVLFVPVEGAKASIMYEEDGKFYDVLVKTKLRGDNWIVEYPVGTIYEDEPHEETVNGSRLDFPLEADVNERFAYFATLTALTLRCKLRSLFVYGEGGLGKSFTLQEVITAEKLVELGDGKKILVPVLDADGEPAVEEDGVTPKMREEEEYDFVRIKGYTTARALFDFLAAHRDKNIVIEDCDSALLDPTAKNIFKAILDTIKKRKVSWMTKGDNASFIFTGSVVFLSNLSKERIDQALISRSVLIDLRMTREEVIQRMAFILPTLEGATDLNEQEQSLVMRLLDKYKHTVSDLNIRTLVKAVDTYRETRDEKLTRYQILNG